MGQCMITRKGTNNNLDYENNAGNNYGSASFTLQGTYKKCLVIVYCAKHRDISSPDLSATVSSGTLTLLKSSRPNVSSGYNMVTYANIYKGKNISGKLTINGGYGLGYTIVYI